MPLSTVLGAQSLVQPAVCTTATRPASPYTGQAIYDTTLSQVLVWNGTVWASVSPTAATTAFTSGSQSTTSTSFTGLTTATAVTVTTGTSALVVATATVGGSTVNTSNQMGYAISGATTAAASANDIARYNMSNTATFSGATISIFQVRTGLTAGSNTFTLQYTLNIAGTMDANDRRITVFPL